MYCFEKYIKRKRGYIVLYVYVIGLFCCFLAFNSLMREVKAYEYTMLHERRVCENKTYETNIEILLSKLNDFISIESDLSNEKLIDIINNNKDSLKLDNENYICVVGNDIRIIVKYDENSLVNYAYSIEKVENNINYKIKNWNFQSRRM